MKSPLLKLCHHCYGSKFKVYLLLPQVPRSFMYFDLDYIDTQCLGKGKEKQKGVKLA